MHLNRQQAHRRALHVIVLLLLALDLLSEGDDVDTELSSSGQNSSGLFQPTSRQGSVPHGYPASVLRSRFVTLDLALFAPASNPSTERIVLNLFDDVILTAMRSDAYPAYGSG